MAYTPRVVAVAATGTLIWQTSTGVSPDPAISPSTGVYQSGTPGDPRPIMVVIPSATTLVIVNGSGGAIGSEAGILGPATIPFNVVGNDALYGAIAGTGTVTVIAGRS
jgi:hypothetical protein